MMIPDENPDEIIILNRYLISLEFWVLLTYGIGGTTFAVLVLYVGDIFDLLNPSNIIKKLSDNITEETISKHIKSLEEYENDRTQPIEEDPVQPIVDIIHGSVMKYDIATTRIGLKAVTDQIIKIIDSDSQEKISRHFCDHLRQVSELTVSKMDERSTIVIIENLYNFEAFAAGKGLEYIALQTVHPLEHVGKAAAKSGLKNAAKQAAESLGYVGTDAVEIGSKVVVERVAYSLGRIGKAAAGKRIKRASKQAAKSLEIVGTSVAEKGGEFEDATVQAVEALKVVGKTAARNELEEVVQQTLESLGQVGRTAAENKLHRAAVEAARGLVFFGKFEMGKEQKEITKRVIWLLEKIGTIAAEKREELEPGTEQVAELEMVIKQVVESFTEIGLFAVENRYDYTTQESARVLAKLTTSSEEAVTVTIQNYESNIRAQYRASFQKFMNLYKHELKKPHPRNPD